MLGTGLNFGRARGEDRFHAPAKPRRSFHGGVENDRLRRAHSDVTASRSSSVRDKSVESVGSREPENRVGSEEAKGVAVPSCEAAAKPLSNLERFLRAITPSVPAQDPSKVNFSVPG